MRLRISAIASADLDEIWAHIAADNADAADRLRDLLQLHMLGLAVQPYKGNARPDIGEGIRVWAVGSYLIIHLVEPGTLHVARVVHGARDVRRAMRSFLESQGDH